MDVPHEIGKWPHVATIELGQNAVRLEDMVDDPSIVFRTERSAQSPEDAQWLEIYVDDSLGTRRLVRIVCSLLRGLQRLAANGVLPDLRIISGEHWLEVGAELDAEEWATPSQGAEAH